MHPIFPGVILPLTFAQTLPPPRCSLALPFLENCTSRSPPGEALPDCRSSPLTPGSHSTLHMAPTTLRQLRVSHCPMSSSKERVPKALGLSPTHRRCLVLTGYVSI